MTAEDKIIKQLEKVPDWPKQDHYYWADYIELLCCVNKDGVISTNELIDRFKNRSEDLGEGELDENDAEENDIDEDNQLNNRPEINDRRLTFVSDCMTQIEYRVNSFKKYYPFILSADKKSISLKPQITGEHEIYFFFLLCSNLGVFSAYKTILTSSFEDISDTVLKKMLPNNKGIAKQFGSSNTTSVKNSGNKTNFFEKLELLAADIYETVKIKKDKLSKYNKGDGGLDLYAWIDFGDNLNSIPLFFGQCACTPEWITKQGSSKFDRWDNFISLKTPPVNFIFIPFCFRNANGEWHQEHKIEKSVLVDRQRFINSLEFPSDILPEKPQGIVKKFLATKESII